MKVICINNKDFDGWFTKGKIYTVLNKTRHNPPHYLLQTDRGFTYTLGSQRFATFDMTLEDFVKVVKK